MPYTLKQRKFFNACKHNPEKMKGKCPSESAKLADEANSMPVKPPVRKYKPKRGYKRD